MTYQLPVVNQNEGHSPIISGDQMDPSVLPVSTYTGNQLRTRADGLYSGLIPELPVLYVNSSTGVDSSTNGAKTSPLQTLDYALNLVATNYSAGQNITIALQAGQTFTVSTGATVACNLVITWYGDTIYGDFNSAQVTTAPNAIMSDLVRPIILPAYYTSTAGQGRLAAIIGPYLDLSGVQVNLPIRGTPIPDPTTYGLMDFYVVTPELFQGRLKLFGAIINALDTLSFSGICGVPSRSQVTLDQFGTQFLVVGAQAASGSTADTLARRTSFIKFYSDYPGSTNQLTPYLNATALNSSNGSGLLNLHWTDTTSATVSGHAVAGSYPVLADVSYGLRNYFTGLRMNGSTPINVTSPRAGL